MQFFCFHLHSKTKTCGLATSLRVERSKIWSKQLATKKFALRRCIYFVCITKFIILPNTLSLYAPKEYFELTYLCSSSLQNAPSTLWATRPLQLVQNEGVDASIDYFLRNKALVKAKHKTRRKKKVFNRSSTMDSLLMVDDGTWVGYVERRTYGWRRLNVEHMVT